MAALTAPRNTPMMGGEGTFKTTQQVKASTKIYQGALVMTDSTGYAVPGATAAGATCWGIALQTIDNSAGASGALSVDCIQEAAFLMNASGLTVANTGAFAYFTDDNTVTLTATSNSKVGTIVNVVSATQCWVYIGVSRA